MEDFSVSVEDWDDLALRSTISTAGVLRRKGSVVTVTGDGTHKSAARDPRGARRRRLEGRQAGPSIKC